MKNHFWKSLFFVSALLSCTLLRSSFDRKSDGDDVIGYYEIGLRDWSELVPMVFLPPGLFPVKPAPTVTGMDFPTKKLFVFDRWRPGGFLIAKTFWQVELPMDVNRVLNWLSCWASALVFGFGIVGVLALGFPLPSDAPWIVATLVGWSPALLLTSTDPFYYLHYPFLLVGLCMLALTLPDRQIGRWKFALAGLFAFLAFQMHENSWWLMAWLIAWLAGLKFFKLSHSKAPSFLWPLGFLMFHLLLYRSLNPGDKVDWTGKGFSADWTVVGSNLAYFVLAGVRGLSQPFTSLTHADHFTLDVTPTSFPWTMILTLGAIAALFRKGAGKARLSAKQKRAFHWAVFSMLIGGLLTWLPYLGTRGHRFVHYTILWEAVSAVTVSILALRLKKENRLALVLFALAGALTTVQYVTQWNWLQFNSDNTRRFSDGWLSRAELKECSPEKPCCVTMPHANWGSNQFILSWNAGPTRWPAYYPEGWPGANCARHVTF